MKYSELEQLADLLRAPSQPEKSQASLSLGPEEPGNSYEPASLDWVLPHARPAVQIQSAVGPTLLIHLTSLETGCLALPRGDYLLTVHGGRHPLIPPGAELSLDSSGLAAAVSWEAPEPWPEPPALHTVPERLELGSGQSARLQIRIERAAGPGLLVVGTQPRPTIQEVTGEEAEPMTFEVHDRDLPYGAEGMLRVRFLGHSAWLNHRSCQIDLPFRRVKS